MNAPVRQMRVVLNVEDLPAALAVYRDALGLAEEGAVAGPDGAHVVILDAGRATLELANPAQSAFIADVETGGMPSTPVRLAFEVEDTAAAVRTLAAAGAPVLAPAVRTPWESLNARLRGPEGLHVTLFQELAGPAALADLVGAPVPPDGEADLLERLVAAALAAAEQGREPFTAAAVRDGVVVGVGVNTGGTDPTAHAEVEAVRDVSRRTGSADLRGVVVYSSCEPCAVCLVVAATTGVEEMVHAAGKDLVPPEIDSVPADLARAVDEVRPGLVRAGRTRLSPEELAAPFAAHLRAAR